MTSELYGRLREVIGAIRDRLGDGAGDSDPFGDVWQRWAYAFVSGLYIGRLVGQIADQHVREAARSADLERLLLCQAAQLAAEAAREGMRGDSARAARLVTEAERLVGRSDALRRGREQTAAPPASWSGRMRTSR